jgi:FtsH-binding integral membrane protein
MTYKYPDVHLHTYIDLDSRDVLESVLRQVYVWMTLGLFLTACVAAFVSASPLSQILTGQPLIFYGLLIAELALVIGLSWGIKRLSTTTAISMFLLYAALNGLTLSVLFLVYSLGSITYTFLASATLFGVMSFIGYTTKIDLAKMGTFLLMGLIGLFIAMIVNIFWANSALGWIVTFAGIFLFLGLTVFDTQRIKHMTSTALQQGDEDFEARLGILGALSLYLDFINLFLFLLRLTGRRR